jgi:hypothetical protein
MMRFISYLVALLVRRRIPIKLIMVDGDVSVYLELITRVDKIDKNNIIKPI